LFWREYQRYCYIYYNFNNKNYFKNNKKLNSKWYSGNTGIDPIDTCIKNGFNTGYLHHIERLMVVGNFMNLSEISPKEGFKWFMEFSCDSYEWVMNQNVYDMVFFVSGGATMRRPYISSSNYILKMSNYKKGKWSEIWDTKYKNFLKKNKDKLWKFRYHFRGLKNI
jgi:deoxyribodipyrimidine photolyase-related protein